MIRFSLLLFSLLALPAPPLPPQPACNDNPKECRKPVKVIGDFKGCFCFACETGTKKERNVCTRDPAERQRLQGMARESLK